MSCYFVRSDNRL